MVSIYDVKPKFQALLRPLTNLLARMGVSANQVTLAAVVLSIAAGAAIGLRPDVQATLFLLPVVLFLRMAFNAIDGMLAREHNMKSNLGAVLNELGDVLSDVALYWPLARVTGFHPELVTAIVLLSVVTEMTGVVAVGIGASRRYDGPMGKSDRAFVFAVLGLVVGWGTPTGAWLDAVLAAVAVLLVLTVVNRARKALKEVQ